MSIGAVELTMIASEIIGIDYPFKTNEEGLAFMKKVEKSGLVTKEQFEMICSGNAKKLLGL